MFQCLYLCHPQWPTGEWCTLLNTHKTKDNFENTRDNAGMSAEMCTSEKKLKISQGSWNTQLPLSKKFQNHPGGPLVRHYPISQKTPSKGKKGKSDPVHTMKVYQDSRGLTPLIFNLSTRWKCQ